MKRLIASVCNIPIVFFIGQYFSALIRCLTNTLEKADPDFPHTFAQFAWKGLLDTVNFIMFATLVCSVFLTVFNYDKYKEEQRKKQESGK